MNESFAQIFSAHGPLARAIPGYAFRREQAQMAAAVGAALDAREPLIVEAGTGTGKTFAYLVPVLLSQRSAIISTGTRALQDQLFHRDVPMLARAIGLPLKLSLLKGRSNYLCRQRLDEALMQKPLWPLPRGTLRHLNSVRVWAAATRHGDLAELANVPEDSPVLALVSSTRENCLGLQCPAFARCHVYEARRAAQAADVVIVNHHLLLADLGLKDEGFGDLLPGADAVILDEAHQVPDIATQFLGLSWSSKQAENLVRDASIELQKMQAFDSAAGAAVRVLEEALHALPRSARTDRLAWQAVPEELRDQLLDIENALALVAQRLDSAALGAGAALSAQRARELCSTLASLEMSQEHEGLRWVDFGKASVRLHFTPFEIADRLRAYVEARPCAWVFTSATLALGDDFGHFAQRVGLPNARALRIDSSFDFRKQALVYLPQGMPPPQDASYVERFIDACAPLLEASNGRAFLLFTSYRGLNEGAAALARRFPNAPFPVLQQGQAPRDALLREFRALGNAVLLATGSFWEGVDVKGDALSIVAIDKLPFASPDDPLLQARLEGIRRRGGNPFFEHQVPQAALALKQGVGRLIRDVDDFGVIVIGDPRLHTKAYGRIFIDALPPSPIVREPGIAANFLREKLAQCHPPRLTCA